MRTIGALLKDLEETIAVCRELGVDIDTGRIAQLRETLSLASLSMHKRRPPYPEILTSLVEAYDIAAIHRISPEILRPVRHRLRRLPEGEFDYANAGADDAGRNAGFEFSVGAYFVELGAGIEFERPSDVVASFDQLTLGIECKRVGSHAGLERQLVRATQQVAGHRAEGFRFPYVVAVDLTRVVNPCADVLIWESSESANDFIQKLVEINLIEAKEELRRAWFNKDEEGYLEAVLYRVLTAVEIPGSAGPHVHQTWQVRTLVPNGSDRFNALYAAMSKAPGLNPAVSHSVLAIDPPTE